MPLPSARCRLALAVTQRGTLPSIHGLKNTRVSALLFTRLANKHANARRASTSASCPKRESRGSDPPWSARRHRDGTEFDLSEQCQWLLDVVEIGQPFAKENCNSQPLISFTATCGQRRLAPVPLRCDHRGSAQPDDRKCTRSED